MNVLSLFDGISIGQLALEELNIKIENYFSVENDKYANSITKYNYPNTIQLGDINDLDIKQLPEIDLILSGFPCPSFSKAGNQKGFYDKRGKLFYKFIEILHKIQPKYFLAENVKMKKEYKDIISKELGVEPILINSALLSAQNRERNYWTNLPVSQPNHSKIYLKDILESGITDKNKSYCIDTNYFKGGNLNSYFKSKRRQLVFEDLNCCQVGEADIKGIDSIKRVYDPHYKAPTLTTMMGGHREPKIATSELTWRKLTPLECERLQTLPDNFTKFGMFDDKIKKISNTQRYKCIGNCWTLEVIKHILKSQ